MSTLRGRVGMAGSGLVIVLAIGLCAFPFLNTRAADAAPESSRPIMHSPRDAEEATLWV